MMILFDIPSDELKPVVPAEIVRSPEDSCDDTTDDLETGQFENLLTISSTCNSDYPLVNIQTTMENHIFFGKIYYKWLFSIAMLNCWRLLFLYTCLGGVRVPLQSWLERPVLNGILTPITSWSYVGYILMKEASYHC
jgi:hypothetical protein